MRLLDFATTIYVVAHTYLQFLLSSLSMLQAVDVLLYLASYDGFLYFHSEVPLGRYHTSSIISKHFLLLLRQGSPLKKLYAGSQHNVGLLLAESMH